MTNSQALQPERIDRLARGLAIGLWIALTVIIAVKTAQNPDNHNTYPIYRDAARAWWDGVNVYDTFFFGSDYRYGPTFAMAILPLAWLPDTIGAVIWAMLNVAVAYWAILATCRRLLPGVETARQRNFVLIATVLPAAHCLYASQTNLLVFALAAFAGIAILDKRWWLAAFLLAIDVHIKVWPLAVAMLLVACWPRRLSWRLLIALLAVAAPPLLVMPPRAVLGQYVEWYQHVVSLVSNRHLAYRDVWTVWELISKPVNPRIYSLLQLGGAAVMFGLCLWQSFRQTPQRLVLFVLVCWTTWQLIFGPGTERNTFSLVAPLTGWAVVIAVTQRRAAWLMITSYLLALAPAMRGIEDLNPWLQVMHPLGIVLFFAWFLKWNGSEQGDIASVSDARGRSRPTIRGPIFARDNSARAEDRPTCLAGENC
jgi:hypothetical protein